MSPLLFAMVVAIHARDWRWARVNRSIWRGSDDGRDAALGFAEATAGLGWWCSTWVRP